MNTKTKKIEKKPLISGNDKKKDSYEKPEFIKHPESAPIEPIKAGKVSLILPWCC